MLAADILPNGLNLQRWFEEHPGLWSIGSSQKQVLLEWGGMRLLKYPEPNQRRVQEPLIVIPSLINRHYILDLLPGHSLLEFLTQSGAQVYVVDWGVPADEDRFLTLDGLIENRMTEFISHILHLENQSTAHLFGHCLGGTLSSIWVSLHPEMAKTLTLLTCPIDFSHSGTLGKWASHPRFDAAAFQQAFDHVPWPIMQGAFHSLKPLAILQKLRKVYKKREDSEFLNHFFAVELWGQDNISFLGSCFQDLIEKFYRQNLLSQDRLEIAGRWASLKNISCPTLNITVADDHIVESQSTLQSSHLSAAIPMQDLHLKGGHIGAIIGPRAQKELWPALRQFVSQPLTPCQVLQVE